MKIYNYYYSFDNGEILCLIKFELTIIPYNKRFKKNKDIYILKLFINLNIIFLLSLVSLHAIDLSEALRVNGYANFYAISNSDENSEDSEKYMDTSGGIQARYQISDNISTTAQIYIQENKDNNRNDSFEVDAKWLYVDYYFGDDWTFRAGLFQFPIFKSAETGTIGYTQTWSETPLESYGANGYEDFKGVELLKKYFYEDFEFLVQLSYGASQNELPTNRDGGTVNGETDNLVGITLKTTYDWFSFNMGYLQATSTIEDMVTGPGSSTSTEEIDFYMYAFEGQVDLDHLSIKAGYIKAKLSDIFPDETRYYGSLEYAYKDFTSYVYYSNESFYFDTDLQNTLSKMSKEKYSAGIRYDFDEHIAFKLSFQKKINRKFFTNENGKFNEYIYKAGINVIF